MPDNSKFKTRKFINNPGDSHYLTFSTYHRKPYLRDDVICQMLADSIGMAQQKYDFAVLSYVFMVTHVHLMIYPKREIYDMADITKSFKVSSSKKAVSAGLIPTVLWEPGGGFDENISCPHARREIIRYIHENPVRKSMVESSVDYKWSSANWYYFGGPSPIQCEFRDLIE